MCSQYILDFVALGGKKEFILILRLADQYFLKTFKSWGGGGGESQGLFVCVYGIGIVIVIQKGKKQFPRHFNAIRICWYNSNTM